MAIFPFFPQGAEFSCVHWSPDGMKIAVGKSSLFRKVVFFILQVLLEYFKAFFSQLFFKVMADKDIFLNSTQCLFSLKEKWTTRLVSSTPIFSPFLSSRDTLYAAHPFLKFFLPQMLFLRYFTGETLFFSLFSTFAGRGPKRLLVPR